MIEDIFTQESARLIVPRSPRRVWTPIVNNNRKRRKRITDALSKERYEAGWWDYLGKHRDFPSGMSSTITFSIWERASVSDLTGSPLGLNITPPSQFQHGHPVKYMPTPYEKYPPTPERHTRFSEEEHRALDRVEKQCNDMEFMRNGSEREDVTYPFILRKFLEILPEGFPFPTEIEEKDGSPEAQWDSEDCKQVWVYFGSGHVYIELSGFYYKDGNPVKCDHSYSLQDGVVKVVSLIERLKKAKDPLKPFKP